jgi:hypothetical protein
MALMRSFNQTDRADNDSEFNEQEMQHYSKMLGDKSNMWDVLVGYLAYP